MSSEARRFVADLARTFTERVESLLARRREAQARFDAGERPDFLPETAAIREADWTRGADPAGPADRRVEITGPVDRKMIINALNSGANVFMADFEDANSPTWDNLVEGQVNLRDAVRRHDQLRRPGAARRYALDDQIATLMVRPRGWHLLEKHVLVDGQPVPAALFDFGLYFFHNARELLAARQRPVLLPAQAGEPPRGAAVERRLRHARRTRSGIPRGTIRATVLIETLPAAFEMDEILYELREHSAGLNCGRWDYIFSFIKKFRGRPGVRAARPRPGHDGPAASCAPTRSC